MSKLAADWLRTAGLSNTEYFEKCEALPDTYWCVIYDLFHSTCQKLRLYRIKYGNWKIRTGKNVKGRGLSLLQGGRISRYLCAETEKNKGEPPHPPIHPGPAAT